VLKMAENTMYIVLAKIVLEIKSDVCYIQENFG